MKMLFLNKGKYTINKNTEGMSMLDMSGIQIMGMCPIFKGLVSKWSGNLVIKVTLHSI